MFYEYHPEIFKVNSIKELHKDIMRRWFYSRYEDPVHSCPYDGREGGYFYIYGGPYDSQEILDDEFLEYVDENVINELVEELTAVCWQWAAVPPPYIDDFNMDYDDNYVFVEPLFAFREKQEQIKQLANMQQLPELESVFFGMLYAHIITSLETYLRDKFISKLFDSNEYINLFLKNNKDLQQKYTLHEIHNDEDLIKKTIKKYLNELLWHNISKIDSLFNITFKIDFGDCARLCSAVSRRHDIIHRCGKNKDGEEIHIAKADIVELIDTAIKLVDNIEEKFKNETFVF